MKLMLPIVIFFHVSWQLKTTKICPLLNIMSYNLAALARVLRSHAASGRIGSNYLRVVQQIIYIHSYLEFYLARLAQSVEHQTLNLVVGGSSPPSGFFFCNFSSILLAFGQSI